MHLTLRRRNLTKASLCLSSDSSRRSGHRFKRHHEAHNWTDSKAVTVFSYTLAWLLEFGDILSKWKVKAAADERSSVTDEDLFLRSMVSHRLINPRRCGVAPLEPCAILREFRITDNECHRFSAQRILRMTDSLVRKTSISKR